MKIERFYDEGLAHASYVVSDSRQAIVIDPARNPRPYYDYADKNGLRITGVIETHPHADFVSSHLEIARATGATIYVSEKVGAQYPHQPFDEGDTIALEDAELRAINTPGHSPDSISIVLRDAQGKDQAVFTGDTLFIGDVGRPDLREGAGNLRAKREELARQMYHSTREKLMPLDEDIIIYPAHGAGSLCGKGMSEELSSTLKKQLVENPALQPMSEDEFVTFILEGQPFVPKYFGYDVDVNKIGAADWRPSLDAVPRPNGELKPPRKNALLIDSRPEADFKRAHYPGAVNIMDGNKFETWLGAIVAPWEFYYLVAATPEALDTVIEKAAKIGYESRIVAALLFSEDRLPTEAMPTFDYEKFKANPDAYTVIDIRNESEVAEERFFEHAINLPLPDLRERAHEIPTDKPVVVHCASGYRSAIGASLIEAELGERTAVYDLGERVQDFKPTDDSDGKSEMPMSTGQSASRRSPVG